MRKAFKYRAYPTKEQESAMVTMLDTHRHLYNRSLAERRDSWQRDKRSVNYHEQSGHLKPEREVNAYIAATNFASCQATLKRLEKAYENFFRRVKENAQKPPKERKKVGYPRFKGRHRFDSVTFPLYGNGCKLKGRHVYFQHIGEVKIELHRPVEGKIKTVTFKREVDHWYVVFSCELPDPVLPPSQKPAIGIDLGLKSFLVTSEGEEVKPPRFYRLSQQKLRRAQRILSRRKKGGKNRGKAGRKVAIIHRKIKNQRRDFHHKTALSLVSRFGMIAHEELNVKGIARTRLAKSTHDAGWSTFLSILRHKAVEAGVIVTGVSAHFTTQLCSVCGALPEKRLTLKDRTYHCAACGHVQDRDLNAACNVLNRAGTVQIAPVEIM